MVAYSSAARAGVAELADAHGSGPCEHRSWGFKSLHPHQIDNKLELLEISNKY